MCVRLISAFKHDFCKYSENKWSMDLAVEFVKHNKLFGFNVLSLNYFEKDMIPAIIAALSPLTF